MLYSVLFFCGGERFVLFVKGIHFVFNQSGERFCFIQHNGQTQGDRWLKKTYKQQKSA